MKVLLLDTDPLRRMRICNLVKMIGKNCETIRTGCGCTSGSPT